MSDEGHADDAELVTWCAQVLGGCRVVEDRTRSHPGQRSRTLQVRTPAGPAFLKTYRQAQGWETEVHAYERWARAFGDLAPVLLAVRVDPPVAIVIGALPGIPLEAQRGDDARETPLWRSAGRALAAFHALGSGPFFGACRRDGTAADGATPDAVTRVAGDLDENLRRGVDAGWLQPGEVAVIDRARQHLTAFDREPAVPCHGDYCPANWMVSQDRWAGVIDFEMARWDVRVADFARLPDWEWVERSVLADAFSEGYAECAAPPDPRQLHLARVQYALTAVVWGMDNDYRGFAREGHRALEHLATVGP